MKVKNLSLLSVAVAAALGTSNVHAFGDDLAKALESGTAYGDFRLRYEMVDQDGFDEDASVATLRTRLGYTTGAISGFTGTLEMEDSRSVLSIDDFNSTQNGKAEFPVVADPDHTELDQAFIKYAADGYSMKLGRQVLTLDNHRFIGHVGWRQDRQTFDALSVNLKPMDGLSVTYAFLDSRNRIFAEARDVDSSDHLINAAFDTGIGKLTGYGYFLKDEDATADSNDTIGVRFSGSSKMDDAKILYTAEFASQSRENAAVNGGEEIDTTYMLLEGGLSISGITGKLGYEVLGSDDGTGGFITPLATLHKFNGWADKFLGTPAAGLVDVYASVSGKAMGGKWVVAYHDFSADEDVAGEDYGSEIDLLYAKKFGKNYNAGIKYAAYSADDFATDTDKLWLWVGAKF